MRLFWSVLAISPVDRKDWFLENLLALSTVVLLLATYRRFQFSNLAYVLITAFLTLHAIGAHYTYAEVPFGFWLQHSFGLSRNPFDRLVHLPMASSLLSIAGPSDVVWRDSRDSGRTICRSAAYLLKADYLK